MKKRNNIYKIIVVFVIIILIYFLLTPFLIINLGKQKIYTDIEKVPAYDIAIVFGAGIKANREPNDMLRDRLDTVAELYYGGKVKKMLLSGDHSDFDYNEPQVMYDYLRGQHNISQKDLIRDYAGLRTYDTCARAKNVLNINKAILISQGYHLSRAIFTCNSLNLESSGLSATRYSYEKEKIFKIREILALHKAVWDVFILPPDYIKEELKPDFIE